MRALYPPGMWGFIRGEWGSMLILIEYLVQNGILIPREGRMKGQLGNSNRFILRTYLSTVLLI